MRAKAQYPQKNRIPNQGCNQFAVITKSSWPSISNHVEKGLKLCRQGDGSNTKFITL